MSIAIPTQDQLSCLFESEKKRFVNTEYDRTLVVRNDDGASMVINGEDVPLLDAAFELLVVQPGHIAERKELKDVKGKILEIWNKDDPTEIAVDELTLLPITIVSQGFRNFGTYGEGEKDLVCYSVDGVVPSSKVPMPLNSVCSELTLRNGEYIRNVVCQYAQWQGNNKPQCRAVVTLAFFDLERKCPVTLQLHGTGYGAWTALQRSWKTAKNVARLKKKSINDYVLKLTVKDEGTYYVPEFRIVIDDTFGDPKAYLPVRKYYLENLFARPVSDAEMKPAVKETVSEVIEAEAEQPEDFQL